MASVRSMGWCARLLVLFLLASRIDSEGVPEKAGGLIEAQDTDGAKPGDVPYPGHEYGDDDDYDHGDEDNHEHGHDDHHRNGDDDEELEELDAEDADAAEVNQQLWFIRRRREPSCEDYGCLPFYSPAADCQCFLTCDFWGSCCDDYIEECLWPFHYHGGLAANETLEKLYYSTTPMMARVLLRRAGALQPQAGGVCGAGIYFATSPAAAYQKATQRGGQAGAVLEAFVDLGRVKDAGDGCDAATVGGAAREDGYDAVTFNPGDGAEYVVYDNARVYGVQR